jgi:hypothetical protein
MSRKISQHVAQIGLHSSNLDRSAILYRPLEVADLCLAWNYVSSGLVNLWLELDHACRASAKGVHVIVMKASSKVSSCIYFGIARLQTCSYDLATQGSPPVA